MRHPSARPEILFVRRQKPENTDINENTREAHVAFPGGRSEQGDEGSLYTGIQSFSLHPGLCLYPHFFCIAMRQTWEEIGLDLAESDYTCVGQLDDREITTSLGKRLLMILSPFGQLSFMLCLLFLLTRSKFSCSSPLPKHLPSLFSKRPFTGYR